jgi:sugar diacid utilization regulator
MMPATNKRKRARARITAPAKQSTVATFRNNQAIRGSYNAIVIMQTTQAAFHKQRKRDSANNANVIMAKHMAHNAIVISSSHGQAFVTFRNISSAYHSHKLSLSIASGRPDTNTDHDHGLIRIRIIIRRRYEYGLKSKNLGGGLAGKIDQGA